MTPTIAKRITLRLTLGTTNIVAAVLLLAGVAILVNGSLLPELSIQASTGPARDISLLLGGSLVLAWILAFGTSADRRCADDYAFQLLASGSIVGMFTMIIASVFWALDFLPDALGIRGMRGQDQMAIGMVAWAVGYFTFRIRGLK